MLIGIVGKPSVGKSTFFQALTQVPVPRAPYPFTTIKPNHGVGYVEIECVDKDFGKQCNPRTGFCKSGRRFVPVELMDVAGLVPGAHEGKGLGNKFLDDLRQADAFIHVVDASGSTNENGESVPAGTYDPINDIIFLEKELDYWIQGILSKNWQKLARLQDSAKRKSADVLNEQLSGLGVKAQHIAGALQKLRLDEKPMLQWSESEMLGFCVEIRKASKPMVIAANKCDVAVAEQNIKRMRERFPDYIIIPVSAEVELALKEASKKGYIEYVPGDPDFKIIKSLDEKQEAALEFMRGSVLAKYGGSGVQRCLNEAVFSLLKYIAVFPGGVNKLADSEGNVLPDVFLMPPGSTALDFAARIHKDMAEKFIRAIDVKTKMALGADHPLKHRDVIEIVFGR
ncbi:MAG: redox-regulated ATPase YchF [Candidatus Micrarchaeota archaeon]|nr:redox-regulated ATPase YchF [Candidatus Micrarchaeota archaeon]